MAEAGGLSVPGSSRNKEKIVKVSAEDCNLEDKDFTAIKIICLGDSAVGKSKLVYVFSN